MKADQQQQAQSLYFQTDLTKTEIAQILGISRRTIHYWVQHNHWDRIRESAQAMPANLAGKCYLIMSNLQDSILSAERADKPVTLQEVNAMHRLTLTIGKLKERGTLNENLEMMTYFMEFVNSHDPRLVQVFKPVVNDYIRSRASEQSILPPAPKPVKEDPTEAQLDLEDIVALDQSAAGNNENTATGPVTGNTATPSSAPPVGSQGDSCATHCTPQPPAQRAPSTARHMLTGKGNNRAARRLLARTAA